MHSPAQHDLRSPLLKMSYTISRCHHRWMENNNRTWWKAPAVCVFLGVHCETVKGKHNATSLTSWHGELGKLLWACAHHIWSYKAPNLHWDILEVSTGHVMILLTETCVHPMGSPPSECHFGSLSYLSSQRGRYSTKAVCWKRTCHKGESTKLIYSILQ